MSKFTNLKWSRRGDTLESVSIIGGCNKKKGWKPNKKIAGEGVKSV